MVTALLNLYNDIFYQLPKNKKNRFSQLKNGFTTDKKCLINLSQGNSLERSNSNITIRGNIFCNVNLLIFDEILIQ